MAAAVLVELESEVEAVLEVTAAFLPEVEVVEDEAAGLDAVSEIVEDVVFDFELLEDRLDAVLVEEAAFLPELESFSAVFAALEAVGVADEGALDAGVVVALEAFFPPCAAAVGTLFEAHKGLSERCHAFGWGEDETAEGVPVVEMDPEGVEEVAEGAAVEHAVAAVGGAVTTTAAGAARVEAAGATG